MEIEPDQIFRYSYVFPSVVDGRTYPLARVAYERWDKGFVRHRTGRFGNQGLFLTAGGRGFFSAGGKRTEISSGSVFMFTSGLPHSIGSLENHEMDVYAIVLQGAPGKRLAQKWIGETWGVFRPGNAVHLLELAKLVFEEARSRRPFFEQTVLHLTLALFTALRSGIVDSKESGSPMSAGMASFMRVKSLIDSRFMAYRSIQQVAADGRVSQPHLTRMFRQHLNITPYQYLLNLKMNQAQNLLQNSEMSIKEIAFCLNFEDPYVFSACFKRQCGISPKHFRKQAVGVLS